ncbi:MAG: glycosyltransferase family 4 protein [Deltaproteobacteria bacterium]|nr:glycosyltransferase family 4 protein [Deltaproteobacteria bacterium]MBW2123040.1 glycosyltransferase family 4 protein [Deltaproteobacteria bacterium]
MKILHLFSDWKWTGPAEPTVLLCEALQKRGHQVTLAYRASPFEGTDGISRRVGARSFTATERFSLRPLKKGYMPFALAYSLGDLVSLRRFIDQERFDIVNVHHSHDHILGGLAARISQTRPVVIRTDHKRDSIAPSPGNRLLVSKLTDGILTFSERAEKIDAANFSLPPERVGRAGVALELEKYDPKGRFRNMREDFNLGERDLVIGMVARFQKYRRTDVFLTALAALVKEFPRVKALLVGRSGQIRDSVIEPTRRLGLDASVVMAGYQTDNYLDTLAAMDIFVFLMAGSDGTARALREAMAMAKPAVVARRGMLPELVEDGETGFVVEDTPDNLLAALRKLILDENLRDRMGRAARSKALREFRLDKQAIEVEGFYERVLRMGPRAGEGQGSRGRN